MYKSLCMFLHNNIPIIMSIFTFVQVMVMMTTYVLVLPCSGQRNSKSTSLALNDPSIKWKLQASLYTLYFTYLLLDSTVGAIG
jgi:hypothetical protein